MIDGNKSYIGFIALGLIGLAFGQGWLTEDMALSIGALVGSFTGVSMRHAIKKSEKPS